MASKFFQQIPMGEPLDTSLGLIMRLNINWQKADTAASLGDFDKWDALLDRIFCNLLYRDSLTSEFDDKGNAIKVSLSQADQKIYDYLNKKITESRNLIKKARTKREYTEAKEKLYKALIIKDVGLRKFQQELKLYYKEKDSNPARSMWGG
jgi:hypothetical protein